MQGANIERLDLYKHKANRVARMAGEVSSKELSDLELWGEARTAYAQLVSSHANYEIAETFFNSIFCMVHEHEHIHDRHIFVLPSRPLDSKPLPEYSIYVRYGNALGLEEVLALLRHPHQALHLLEAVAERDKNALKYWALHGKWMTSSSSSSSS